MATLVGTTFPTPQASTSSGLTVCNYNDTSSGVSVVVDFTNQPTATPATVQTVMASQAAAQKATLVPVAGIGAAAYLFTLDNASANVSGVATSTIQLLAGTEVISIVAEATVARTEALARYLVAQH